MNDKALAKSLLELDAARPPAMPEDEQQTQRILRRDRRWIRILTWLTILFWIGVVVVFYYFVFSFLALYTEIAAEGNKPDDPLVEAVYRFMLLLASSVEGLVFAGFFTWLLLFVSRRATLRQINANLIEISQQLKRLHANDDK